MGRYDPVDLAELGAALRDGTLLDVRSVDAGLLERVAVTGIMVRRDGEEIEFSRDDASLMVAADSIRRAIPSAFGPDDDLARLGKSELSLLSKHWEARLTKLRMVAEEAVAFRFKMMTSELQNISHEGLDNRHLRYWVMLVMYQLAVDAVPSWLSGEVKTNICLMYGYKSIQPFTSAMQMLRDESNDTECKLMVNRARAILGGPLVAAS